ncbi:MAG: UDP-3-O-acyl-N-acetylglucosamine deacetylase [Cyanobacteria bacterium]|nr:UDP-3-O-acyl-N-acetylglucosamine deacetylase [Cyanobacteriota bacterium]
MSHWPADFAGAHTLASEGEIAGVGLHSGASGRVRLAPSSRPGFWLGWLDRPGSPLQRLAPTQVWDTTLCTALEVGGRRLATVEHLLAALAGTGVTQAEIWVDGPEVPLLDGSALPWVDLIASIGLHSLGPCPPAALLQRPLTLHAGASFVTAIPADGLHLGAAIAFDQPAIGRQFLALELTPQRFVEEIAPARTFGLRSQVEQLRHAGLIQGGGLDNALVCDGDRWLNPPLRFADEPVRHKILDLLGDLALVGLPRAQVFAYRGSHRLHTALAAALAAEFAPSPA